MTAVFGNQPRGGFAPGGVRQGHGAELTHYSGRGIDIFLRPVTEKNRRAGLAPVQWLIAHADDLEIQYVLFDDKIWSAHRCPGHWQTFKTSRAESHHMTSTPPLQLRPFDATDVPFFANMATDPRVTKYVGDGSTWDQATIAEKTTNALRDAPVHAQGAARWFVALHHDQPVGILVSTRREAGVEIGYWVSPEHWGRGIAGAMVDAALEILPTLYNSDHLIARVDPDNAASARVLTRRGFHTTGCDNGLDRYLWEGPSSAAP